MSESSVVSGPGSMSRRTDMASLNPDSAPYGEQAEVAALQAAAPGGPQPGPAQGGGGGGAPMANPLDAIVGLGEPGQANLPVTAGADAGMGVGPNAMGMPFQQNPDDARQIDPALLNILVHQSMQSDATPSFRRWVRQVIAHRN